MSFMVGLALFKNCSVFKLDQTFLDLFKGLLSLYQYYTFTSEEGEIGEKTVLGGSDQLNISSYRYRDESRYLSTFSLPSVLRRMSDQYIHASFLKPFIKVPFKKDTLIIGSYFRKGYLKIALEFIKTLFNSRKTFNSPGF